MIGERKIRLRTNLRHVTSRASLPPALHLVTRRRVALPASRIVSAQLRFERRVRRMTVETAQPAFALAKAPARRQEERLMPRVPGISQARLVRILTRHTMTLAAQCIDLVGRHPARIHRAMPSRLPHMRRRRSVTRFAAHSQLVRNHAVLRRNLQRTRRMARKAAQHRSRRVEDSVLHSVRARMPGCPRVPSQFAIPASAFLQVVFRIEPPHESDRLPSRSECPVSGLRRLRGYKRTRVRRFQMRPKLSRVTALTR